MMSLPPLPRWWPALLPVLGCAMLYLATMSPDVQAGDSAEFQLAAVIGGVPHPTTYPLYVLLGRASAMLVPWGVPAWRVTLVSVVCAALALAVLWRLLWRLGESRAAATLAVLALGLAPGVWHAATIAEVYALLLLLLLAFAGALQQLLAGDRRAYVPVVGLGVLGSLHHGLFVVCAALPGALALWWAWRRLQLTPPWRPVLVALVLGMAPQIYPLAQFARLGPFDGHDYGLPAGYFWGAPRTWGEVLDLMTGGAVRRGIFAWPDATGAALLLAGIARRLLFEFGPAGVAAGACGLWLLARERPRCLALVLALAVPALGYLLALGPAVGDWPVFTLPLLIPWTLGIAWGVRWIARHAGRRRRTLLLLAMVLVLAWGATRYRVSAKQHLTLYREFAAAVHQVLPADAVVVTHWEQGMTLQYLRFAEGRRADVWIDVVEPGDDPWLARARRRYPGRPVFFVGQPASVAGLPVTLLLDAPYADVYRLDPE